jgi:hypothetical protein
MSAFAHKLIQSYLIRADVPFFLSRKKSRESDDGYHEEAHQH